VRLKRPSEFRLIGRRVGRLDSRPKCDGSQKFGFFGAARKLGTGTSPASI
jgi:hypothetical protein